MSTFTYRKEGRKMCQFKSGIVLKDKVFCPLDYDSHEEMIKELKLKDDTTSPNFVRVEIIPADGNIFNHDLKNWQLKVDQDFRPDWFSEKFAETEMKKALKDVFNSRFLIDREIKEISEGRWFLKNGKVDFLLKTAFIEQMRESSQVGTMRGSSQVGTMWESSQVGTMWGSSQVKEMRGSSQVKEMRESSLLKDYKGDKPIIYTPDKSIKLKIWKNKL
jgi:hypothetical protein